MEDTTELKIVESIRDHVVVRQIKRCSIRQIILS